MINISPQNLDKPRPRLNPEIKTIAGESPPQEKNEKFSSEKVRLFSRDFFENIFSSLSDKKAPENKFNFFALEDLQNKLSELANCQTEWQEKKLYTENFREATNIILEELLSYCQEKKDDKRINEFLSAINEMFFSSSPNLSSTLDLKRHFDFAAKATRLAELQIHIGSGVISDLAYKIGWHYSPDTQMDKLLESYNESSIPEKLDKLNLMEILGADLIAAGGSYNYGDKKILKLLEKIKRENNNAFIGYYIDTVSARLKSEYKQPSRGIIQYTNDPGNARLNERLSKKDVAKAVELQNIIKPNRALKPGEKIIQVASDLVGIFNHSNIPVEYAKVDLSNIKNYRPGISGTFLVNAREALEKRDNKQSELLFHNLIEASNHNIFSPYYHLEANDYDELAKIWHTFDNKISNNEWEEYFALSHFRDSYRKDIVDYKADELSKTEGKNFEATLKVFAYYKEEIPQLLTTGIKNAEIIKQLYEELNEALAEDDSELAFDKVSHLAIIFSRMNEQDCGQPEQCAIIKKLAENLLNLREIHSANWQEFNDRINNFQNQSANKNQEKIIRFNELAEKIEKNKDSIIKKYLIEIKKIADQTDKDKINAEFVEFKELIGGEYNHLLKGGEIDTEALLFQHLYRPKIKMQIEEEFGINLNDLASPYHVHFLKFLSEKDRGEIEKVKNFLNGSPDKEAKTNRIKAFLALGQGQDMGNTILNLGELLINQPQAADALFSEYAQLVNKTEQTAEELSQMYKEIFYEKQVDKNQISQAMLKRASQLLLEAEEKLKQTPENDKVAIIKELIEGLVKEQMAQKIMLDDLKKIADRCNYKYSEINLKYENQLHDARKAEIRNGPELSGASEEEVEEYMEYLDTVREMRFHPAVTTTLQEYNEQIEEEEKHHRFDSQRLKNLILEMEKPKQQESPANSQLAGFINELKKLLEYQKNLEQKLEQIIYGHEAAELPANYEKEIEKEIDGFKPELPKETKSYLPVGVSSLLPQPNEIHAKPIDALTYLFWLNNQGKKSEFMVVDSIQETNYQALYPDLSTEQARKKALENGGRDKSWYRAVIQVFNLKNVDAAEYQTLENSEKMKHALKLIDDLDQGAEGIKSPVISRALNNLLEKNIGEKAETSEKDEAEKKRLLKQYGKTEIAFIIAKGGEKISHEKEYRYDILARIMPIYQLLKEHSREVKDLLSGQMAGEGLKKIGRRLSELDEDQALIELCLYLAYYDNFPKSFHLAADLFSVEEKVRNAKNQASNNQDKKLVFGLKMKTSDIKDRLIEAVKAEKDERESVAPVNQNISKLGLLEKGKDAGQVIAKWRGLSKKIMDQPWYRNINLPRFYYPKNITGLSFEMQSDTRPGFTAFREFYSTYKGKKEEGLPIEANQVIASTNPMAVAKLLVLDEKKQGEYFTKVLKPLLINFYIATSKSKEEATDRFNKDIKAVNTISEVINLIQKKIIWPVELELRDREKLSVQSE